MEYVLTEVFSEIDDEPSYSDEKSTQKLVEEIMTDIIEDREAELKTEYILFVLDEYYEFLDDLGVLEDEDRITDEKQLDS